MEKKTSKGKGVGEEDEEEESYGSQFWWLGGTSASARAHRTGHNMV